MLRKIEFKERQKNDYDRRHRARPLPSLPNDSDVWVNTQGNQVSGQIVSPASTPQSYIIDVPTGHVRRNRAHIIPQTTPPNNAEPPSDDTKLLLVQDLEFQ